MTDRALPLFDRVLIAIPIGLVVTVLYVLAVWA